MSRILFDGENQITNGYREQVHEAVDVVKRWYQKDTVIAHSSGVVVMIQKGMISEPGTTGTRGYGNFIKIRHDNGYYTLYAHLESVYVRTGEKVQQGEKIGFMGNTGNAYGVHLHFEVRTPNDIKIDPVPYLDCDLPNHINILNYQVYDNIKKYWLTNVSAGTNEYAGNFSNPIGGIYADKVKLRVHDKRRGYWLPWVENRSDYAGNIGYDIDGVQIENATYRVHLRGGTWLPWVNNQNDCNNEYAGIYGRSIDAIQIK